MFSAELLGQQFTVNAVTGAISDRTGLNALRRHHGNGRDRQRRRTIGTTAVSTVVGGKITWQNNWMPVTHNKGQLFYDDAVREVRSLSLELDVHFKDTTELAALLADSERLIRVTFTGPVIAGSTGNVPESVKVDFYGFYLDAAFSPNKAIRMLKLVGESQFDTAAGFDWQVACATSVAVLP
jgi:hypothetical protein